MAQLTRLFVRNIIVIGGTFIVAGVYIFSGQFFHPIVGYGMGVGLVNVMDRVIRG